MNKKFGILGGVTHRTLKYLSTFKKQKLDPEIIIIYGDKIDRNLLNKLKSIYRDIIFFNSKLASNQKIINFLLRKNLDFTIYSGYPGEILKINFNKLKFNFLHSHTGKLPYFKGSTTIYYSILSKKKIFCSTFIMSKRIDCGETIYVKEYPLPKNIMTIENSYDDEIRAQNFIDIIKSNKKVTRKKFISKPDETKFYYFIAHPFLRRIAINKFRNKNSSY